MNLGHLQAERRAMEDDRSTGPAYHQYPPMQCQQWHAVPDTNKKGQPMGDRATIYSDDERIVCQTLGTWNRGPGEEEHAAVIAMIAAAPDLALALFNLEALVTAVLAMGKWPEGTSLENPGPTIIEARRTLKSLMP